MRKVPPTCGRHTDEDTGLSMPGCGAPGQWAYLGEKHAKVFIDESGRRRSNWVLIDAAGLSDDERLGKVRYDPAVHVRHVCKPATSAPTASVGGLDARTYLAGCIAAEPNYAPLKMDESDEEWRALWAREVVAMADALLAELAKEKP
jgi:hypothetical protein